MDRNHINVSQVGARLAGHVASLADMTNMMGDANSTYVLKHLEPRLRQGLVRIAVVGVTSTGKSTAINALVGEMALPENPSVSSPIPVWLGYHDEQTAQATIYQREGEALTYSSCDLTQFKRKYCYNIDDIANRDRTRYNAVEFGAIDLNSPLLKEGLTLIDTLGIAASSVDSRKTIRVLEDGVDAVVFFTKNTNLNMAEVEFLYRHVLGCRNKAAENKEGEAAPKAAVTPENLILVYNDWYGMAGKTAFQESIRTLYRNSDLELDESQIEQLVKENTFFINAFHGRLATLGVYPYSSCAPEGSSKEALDSLLDLEDYENEELECSDTSQMLAESGISTLAEAIRHKAWSLCFGKNSVAVRRVSELLPVVDGVIEAANNRVAALNITITDLNQKKGRFNQLRSDDQVEQSRISTDLMELNISYQKSFTRLLEDITPTLKSDCAGKALLTEMPEEFREQYREFTKKSPEGKEQYLKAVLHDLIRTIYEDCTAKLLKALDETKSHNYKTPFEIMEETRTFIASQAVLLNARIDSLERLGAKDLGVIFPENLIVEKLFKKLELDLAEKVKEIIANSCRMSGQRFQENMQAHVRKCKLNIFLRILPGAPDRLWDKIRKELFVPLAESVVDGMSDYTAKNIFFETTAAFDMTKTEICNSHTKLFYSLESAILRLEEQARSTANEKKVEVGHAAKLEEKCQAIKQDILYIQSTLQA